MYQILLILFILYDFKIGPVLVSVFGVLIMFILHILCQFNNWLRTVKMTR